MSNPERTDRHRPDPLTVLFGLAALAVSGWVLLDGIDLPMGLDGRWLIAGPVLVAGLVLVVGSRRPGHAHKP